MYQYPYGDTQQLNLNWFLDEFRKLQAAWEQEKAGIDGALDAEIAKAEAALADVFAARDAAAASASSAAQSAQEAGGYLDTVEADATAARNAASNANRDATAASGSAQNAAQSAINASGSAQNAAQSALSALNAKNDAGNSATAASGSASAAADSATAAAGSASAAADSATAAAGSAEEAETAAGSVTESAAQITQNADDIAYLKNAIDVLENLEKNRGFTAEQFQIIAASGHADDYFAIGDIITIPWVDRSPAEPVTYQVPHVIVHFGDVEDENGVVHPNVPWLMWQYAVPSGVQFDYPEAIRATEPTFTEGYYYYIQNGSDFVEQTVTYGEAIPSGTTYYHHVRSGMSGRLRYGSNDWSQSAMRQWLNSTGGKGEWWTAQHDSDVAPDQATTMAGFLSGYDSDWLSVFKPVKVQTALNTVCDGGVTVTTFDKFFLPSLEQMYGLPQVRGVEGDYWEYWKEETGLASPSNGSSSNTNEARKIPSIANIDGGAVYCRLRSVNRSNTYYTWYCNTAGHLGSSYFANYATRALPACVIY